MRRSSSSVRSSCSTSRVSNSSGDPENSLFVSLRDYGFTNERMDQMWNAAIHTGQVAYFGEDRLWYVAHSDRPQIAQFIENWTGGSDLDTGQLLDE